MPPLARRRRRPLLYYPPISPPRSPLISPDVKGEYIRSDIAETQPGVEVILDLQFIDISTCLPIADLTADIWHCNSTGVYAGVVSNGNGDSTDTSNIDATFCRGLQTTDANGAVQFTSIFPGHYSGRATHVHIEAHLDGTVLPNSTYTGGSIAHIAQFFFDQALITEVEALSPYAENTIAITTNAEDRVVQGELVNDADPILEYVLLGETVADGLFMWISFGVNQTATYTASPAAELASDGGHAVSSGGSVGGGGASGGNGTFPSGGGPNGTMPSGSAGSTGDSASVTTSGTASPRYIGSSANMVSSTVNGTLSTTSSILTSTFTSGATHKNVPGFGKLGSKKPKSGKGRAKVIVG